MTLIAMSPDTLFAAVEDRQIASSAFLRSRTGHDAATATTVEPDNNRRRLARTGFCNSCGTRIDRSKNFCEPCRVEKRRETWRRSELARRGVA